jgi:hypothetical protein
MAAQPNHTMLATAPRYCHHYNQQHHLPLVSRPLPLEPLLLENAGALYPAMAQTQQRQPEDSLAQRNV